MKRGAIIDNTNAGGLQAVRETHETLPDLCHHAEYRIYVDGQYVESAGSIGIYTQHVLEFWKRRRRKQTFEARPTRCALPNCGRGRQ
jgi:hypothetical protein